jgi:hypothetical protein
VQEAECQAIPWDWEESDCALVELPDHEKGPEKDGLVRAGTASLRFANCEMNKEGTEESSDPKANGKRNHLPELTAGKTRKGGETAGVRVPRIVRQHCALSFFYGLYSIANQFCENDADQQWAQRLIDPTKTQGIDEEREASQQVFFVAKMRRDEEGVSTLSSDLNASDPELIGRSEI